MTTVLEPVGNQLRCDLCSDVDALDLRARCHPTAPLRIEIENSELKVFCYVPECNRFVAAFRVKEERRGEIDWLEYEARKKEIQSQNLSPEEYEQAIRQMVEDLDSESDEEKVA